MTPDPLVPVPLRVRRVVPGDEFVSTRDGSRWRVTSASDVLWRIGGREITAECENRTVKGSRDPDDTVNVLIPVVERDAVELLHRELGARLIGQRTV